MKTPRIIMLFNSTFWQHTRGWLRKGLYVFCVQVYTYMCRNISNIFGEQEINLEVMQVMEEIGYLHTYLIQRGNLRIFVADHQTLEQFCPLLPIAKHHLFISTPISGWNQQAFACMQSVPRGSPCRGSPGTIASCAWRRRAGP